MIQQHSLVVANGDSAFTIQFDLPISETLTRQIIALSEALKQRIVDGIIETIPAYQSLTICFDPLILEPNALREILQSLLLSPPSPSQKVGRLIEIPVCYADEYAPDLLYVANHCQISVEEVVKLHTAPEYLVHMLGFTPGFLYLGGLPEQLHCPRKAVPETRVPAGSVGIGGNQTGIYPQATPGGWQIIGRTTMTLFCAEAASPFVAQPLDRIKFVAITRDEFQWQTEFTG